MTRAEDVADLREGDVVELRYDRWPDVVTRGPLEQDMGEWLSLGGVVVASRKEGIAGLNRQCTLTVVSRAPRPLYVNHPRTEPEPGDVVRDADDESDVGTYHCSSWPGATWYDLRGSGVTRDKLPARLRLLVDGTTGQVVP